jgi:hypothetical protein
MAISGSLAVGSSLVAWICTSLIRGVLSGASGLLTVSSFLPGGERDDGVNGPLWERPVFERRDHHVDGKIHEVTSEYLCLPQLRCCVMGSVGRCGA